MRVADHIKHLERIIENGELLRDQMRRTAEAREAIIRSQAGKLKQLSEINTLYKNRRNRAVMRLQKARNEIKLVEAKLKKLERLRLLVFELLEQQPHDLFFQQI